MYNLVNQSRRKAQSELVDKVYQAADLEKLLVEDPIVAANREACKEVISIPVHPSLTAQDLEKIVTVINSISSEGS